MAEVREADEVNEALLRRKAVSDVTGLSRSVIYELERRGLFPRRVALGPRTVAWKASEVQAWIKSRLPKVA